MALLLQSLSSPFSALVRGSRVLSTVSRSSLSSPPQSLDESRGLALDYAEKEGFDLRSAAEVQVHWGEQDVFRHINNAHYLRYLETGRVALMRSFLLEHRLPKQQSDDLLNATGLGFILAEITLKYRRPVTYPDSLVCFHKPSDIQKDRFKLQAILWSLQQRTVVTTSDCSIVGYDYRTLKKADFSPELATILQTLASAKKAS
ncbi:Thioesterase/thiol ester dehydrase-isomerase [Atractiella rhizophila]|nr:Thioesterase/thiol ester dehydrase-isomerase [Atractiella rhizophila]